MFMKIRMFSFIIIGMFMLSACSSHMGDIFSGSSGNQGNDDGSSVVVAPIAPQYEARVVDGVYKVGVMLPTSHPKAAKIAKSIQHSVQLAFIESGRRDIELIFKDTKGDPAIAAKQAEELAAAGVSIIIGPLYSSNVQAITPIIQQHKIIVLGLTNDRMALAQGIQIMGFQPEDDARALKRFVKSRGFRNVGVLSARNTRGDRFIARFDGMDLKMMNADIVRNQNGADPSNDVRHLVNQNNAVILANTSKQLRWELSYVADAMANILEPKKIAEDTEKTEDGEIAQPERPAIADMIKHAMSNNIQLPLIIGTSVWNTPSILKEKGADHAVISMYDIASYNHFSNKFKAQMGYDAHFMTGMGYDAMFLTKDIIERGYSSLFTTSKNGVYGRFGFTRNGVIERDYLMYQNNKGVLRPVY